MVTRVELSISERFPFAEGHEFGAVGGYKRLVGRAHFAVDPGAPAQQGITDIDKAPVDAEGLIRVTGDLSLLKPADPRPAIGGFSSITGTAATEHIAERPGITTFPLSGHASTRNHPTVSPDPREAYLTRRRLSRRPADPGATRELALRASRGRDRPRQPVRRAGADPIGHAYFTSPADSSPAGFTSVCTRRNPLVLGLGHAAARDFVSFLRYEPDEAAGLGTIEKACAWGRSQTGRCIRDFVYRGCKADAARRKVFDGVLPHVAGAGRKWLNQRFANAVEPSRT